jgi:hypothetical protein
MMQHGWFPGPTICSHYHRDIIISEVCAPTERSSLSFPNLTGLNVHSLLAQICSSSAHHTTCKLSNLHQNQTLFSLFTGLDRDGACVVLLTQVLGPNAKVITFHTLCVFVKRTGFAMADQNDISYVLKQNCTIEFCVKLGKSGEKR